MALLQREELLSRLSGPIPDRLHVVPLLDIDIQVGPASIDLRLGSEFIEVRRRSEEAIDPFKATSSNIDDLEDRYEIPFGEHLVLHPGQFLLGSTFEFLRLPRDLGGQVLSRSSWGRYGLIVATAVTVQPGFAGCLTLELQNLGTVPIRLHPGLRVAQLMLWSTFAPLATPIDSTGESPPLGPVSRKAGWTDGELLGIKRVRSGLVGA